MNDAASSALMPAAETSVMTVWPTIAATRAGRAVGKWSAAEVGLGKFFTVGKLMALLTIPVSLAVFFWQLMPYVCRRYRLTNRRVIVLTGLGAVEGPSIALDEFDAVEVDVLAGQAWHHAGDLVFRRDGTEVFRLSGVSRPDAFRQVCLETRDALLSVRKVLHEQAAAAQPA